MPKNIKKIKNIQNKVKKQESSTRDWGGGDSFERDGGIVLQNERDGEEEPRAHFPLPARILINLIFNK